jgi:hypothetical protein
MLKIKTLFFISFPAWKGDFLLKGTGLIHGFSGFGKWPG